MERFDKIHAWTETGETLCPQRARFYLCDNGAVLQAMFDFSDARFPIVKPVPGPLYRLEPGESVISVVGPGDDWTHCRSKATGNTCPRQTWHRPDINDHDFLRIEPVAVPQDSDETNSALKAVRAVCDDVLRITCLPDWVYERVRKAAADLDVMIRVEAESTINRDTTDFPKKPCRQCGKMDRPQFNGICNDDHCSH